MFLGREFAPQNIKLRANSNILPNLIDPLNAPPINDDLEVLGLVGADDAGQDVDEGRFARPVVAQNAHQLVGLDLQGEVFYGLDAGFGE
jgi:hypothetical protein